MSLHSIYGITILQAYIYFRNNAHDSRHMGHFVSQDIYEYKVVMG